MKAEMFKVRDYVKKKTSSELISEGNQNYKNK